MVLFGGAMKLGDLGFVTSTCYIFIDYRDTFPTFIAVTGTRRIGYYINVRIVQVEQYLDPNY
jgi:hypothetical protein